jgi:hypothetical protein
VATSKGARGRQAESVQHEARRPEIKVRHHVQSFSLFSRPGSVKSEANGWLEINKSQAAKKHPSRTKKINAEKTSWTPMLKDHANAQSHPSHPRHSLLYTLRMLG